MTTITVFDPAMCCSTGICGPGIDPELARFAADLDHLSAEGVAVERFNLAQQPEAFVAHSTVTEALRERGDGALPLVMVDGRTVIEGAYPTRDQLVRWAAATGGTASPAAVPAGDDPAAQACGCGDGDCC